MPAYPTQAVHKHAPLQSVEVVAEPPGPVRHLPKRRDACPERATATSIACLRGHASASAGLPRRPDPGCVRARAAQLRRRVQRSSAVVGRPSRDRSQNGPFPSIPQNRRVGAVTRRTKARPAESLAREWAARWSVDCLHGEGSDERRDRRDVLERRLAVHFAHLDGAVVRVEPQVGPEVCVVLSPPALVSSAT